LFFDGFEVVLIKNFIVDIKGRGQNGTEFKWKYFMQYFFCTSWLSLPTSISCIKLVRCVYTLALPKQWTLSDDRWWRYNLCMPNWMDRKSMWIWFVGFKITNQIAKWRKLICDSFMKFMIISFIEQM
jgi:hypothetical protein